MDYNYAELLDFDRAASVTLTNTVSARKLAAWEDRLTLTDYPAEWQVDLLTGDYVTLELVASAADTLRWEGKDYDQTPHSVTITFVDDAVTSFVYEGKDSSATLVAVSEGLLELENDTQVSICDADIRTGESELRVTYPETSRASISVELDDYCQANLGRIADTTIKGHKVIGTWRLSEVRKRDSDNPDSLQVVLIYKRGYAKTLDFDEAIIMNMVDYKENSASLVLKFPNIDPRYAETAKDAYRSTDTLTNPVIGGVVYDGYWSNIKMETSEVSSQYAELEDAVSVVWFLSRHNNTNLYFRYYDAETTQIKGRYLKWEATKETLAELFETVEFDANGYVVESGGVTLNTALVGRSVRVQRISRDESDRLFDVDIEITWRVAATELMTRVVDGNGSVTVNYATYGTEAEVDARISALKFDADGLEDAGGASLATTVAGRSVRIRKIYRKDNPALFDVEALINWAGSSAKTVTIKVSETETRTIEKVDGATSGELDTAAGTYGGAPVSGTTRSFDFKLRDDGLYDYIGMLVVSVSKTYGGTGNEIITFGEPLEVTTFVAKYVGDNMPSTKDVTGEYTDLEIGDVNPLDSTTLTVKCEGRQKTVTRIKNANIAGGLFNYDLFSTQYTAPINGAADAWFKIGDKREWDREVQKVNTGIGAQVDTTPIVSIIGIYRRRLVTRIVSAKFFIRQPTTADQTAAGISYVDPDTPVKGGPAPTFEQCGHEDISYEVRKVGGLYAIYKIDTEYGDWEFDWENAIEVHAHGNVGQGDIDGENSPNYIP